MRLRTAPPLALLALLALPTSLVSAQSPSGARTPPGDQPEPKLQATPDVEHPVALAAPIDAVGPAVVDASRLPVAGPDELAGPPRFHEQGYFADSPAAEAKEPRSLVEQKWPSGPTPARPGGAAEALGDWPGLMFDGIAASGWIPPDTVHAVGPRDVVEATNSGYAIWSKTGTLRRAYTTFETLFAPLIPPGWAGFTFDPRLGFNASLNRYVMLVLGLDQTNQDSFVFVGVSQTSDPNGLWWIYRFADPFNTDAWIDYAGLGIDDHGLYFTGNEFYWAGGFKHAIIWSVVPAIYSGGAASGWIFWDLRWPDTSLAFGLQPAIAHSTTGDGATFFVNTYSGWGNVVCLWKLTGPRDNNPTLTRAAIGTGAYQMIGMNVDQPGSATHIDGGDARVMDAVYAQRRVYLTFTSADQLVGPTQSRFVTVKLDVDANTNVWENAYGSGAGVYYFYPAITLLDATSQTPRLAVGMSWTQPSFTVYASTALKIYANHPVDASGAFWWLNVGLAPYVAFDGSGRNRWGDYSGNEYDWSCNNFWSALQYAGAGNSWRTSLARHSAAAPGVIHADPFEAGNLFCWNAITP